MATIAELLDKQGKFSIQSLSPEHGDIYYMDFSKALDSEEDGSYEKGKRPGICISNNNCNIHSDILYAIPLSGSEKSLIKARNNKVPTQVILNKNDGFGLYKDSVALIEQMGRIRKENISLHDGRIGKIDKNTMLLIERAIKIQFGLEEKKIFNMQHVQNLLNMIEESKKLSSTREYLINQFESYCKEFNKNPDSVICEIKNYNTGNKMEILLAN